MPLPQYPYPPTLRKVRSYFELDQPREDTLLPPTYGSLYPIYKREGQTGWDAFKNFQFGMPQWLAYAGRGYTDLLASPYTGTLTPEAFNVLAFGQLSNTLGPVKVGRNTLYTPTLPGAGLDDMADDAARAGKKGIKAYHGGPYDFGEFDNSRIGTGQGAAMYGRGHYFAQEPDVARDYFRTLGHKSGVTLTSSTDGMSKEAINLLQIAGKNAHQMGLDSGPQRDMAMRRYLSIFKDGGFTDDIAKAADDALAALDRGGVTFKPNSGRIYEVAIKGQEDDFLDFFKPLKDQPEKVQKAVKALPEYQKLTKYKIDGDQVLVDRYPEAGAALKAKLMAKDGGPTYHVKVKGPEGWDATISGNSPEKAIANAQEYIGERAAAFMEQSGQDLLYQLQRDAEWAGRGAGYVRGRGEMVAADRLKRAGLKGIKYPDQFSRGKADQTFNYVVFDAADTDILSKYADPDMVVPTNRYLEPGAPVLKDKRTGKIVSGPHENWREMGKAPEGQFWSKNWTPEEEALMAKKAAAQERIKAGDYKPYFKVEDRYDVNPRKYPARPSTRELNRPGSTMHPRMPLDKFADELADPKVKEGLWNAYQVGKNDPGNQRFYQMGQLEKKFIDYYGESMGRQKFKERFADAMAATTGGMAPDDNLRAAAYANYQHAHGRPAMADASHQYPAGVGGGKYGVHGNMKQADRLVGPGGKGLTPDNAKRMNFSSNFLGDENVVTLDEQMARAMQRKEADFLHGAYGPFEDVTNEVAKQAGVTPRNMQEVAWGGQKAMTDPNFKGQPMIQTMNEALARTSMMTGLTQEQVLEGFMTGTGPLYSRTLGTGLAPQLTPGLLQGMMQPQTPGVRNAKDLTPDELWQILGDRS